MPDRRSWWIAATLSRVGLLADLSWFTFEGAIRFFLVQRWAEVWAYTALSVVIAALVATVGWRQVKVALGLPESR